jgi:type IV pilus assembly protein PilV
MKTHALSRSPAHQSGVGLIEVLIAVLVLSIGFLGVAALEAMSLSTNNSAYARSMATINAYSILDAMRADLGNAKAGSYNTTTPVKASSCPAAGTTLATQQLNVWCGSLAATLGANDTTTGSVNCDTNGNCTITIAFDDSRAGSNLGSSAQTFTTQGIL